MRSASGALISFLAGLDPHFLYADLFTITQNPTNITSTPVSSGPIVQIWNGISSDGAAFAGGLDQLNFLTASQDFENAAWTKANATVTPDNVTDPLGGTTADTVNFSASGTGALVEQIFNPPSPAFPIASTPFIFSCFLKVPSGTPTLNLLIENQAGTVIVNQTFTLSTNWQRLSVSGTMGVSDTGIRVFIYNPSATGNYHFWGAQLQLGFAPGTLTFYSASRDTISTFSSAYSGTLMGSSALVNGIPFNFAAAGGYSAGWGETVSLPAGQYNYLYILGTGVNGNQPSQSFQVDYTDSTHDTFVQGLSDWFTPQNYPGESVGRIFPYRNLSNGTKDNRVFYLYQYVFALNPGKTVLDVKFPANPNVTVLAMTLVSNGGRTFFYTNADVDIVYKGSTFRSGRGEPSPNVVADSDGFDLEWSVPAGMAYSTAGGANGGGSWTYTGTGSPSGFLFPQSAQFNLIPGLPYLVSGYIDASQASVNSPILELTDSQVRAFLANVGQTPGASGRVYAAGISPSQLTDTFPDQQLASDNFTRANANPIGGNWTTAAGLGALQLVSNAVEATAINTQDASYYNAVTWPADQYSQITVGALASNNDFVGAAVRVGAAGSGNYYSIQVQGPIGSTAIFFIQKMVSGVKTNLVTLTNQTLVSGDVFRIEVNGVTITALRNGVQIMQTTDTSLASGNAGMTIEDVTTIGNGTITAWAGGTTDPNGSWIVVTGNFSQSRNVFFGGNSSGSRAFMVNRSIPVPPDQYAQMTVASLPASWDGLGPAVRGSAGSANYYAFYVTSNAGGTYFIFRVIAGAVTVLKQGFISIAVNDVLRLEVVGSTLTARKNGVVVDTAVDFSLSSGYTGLQTEPNNPTSMVGKNFVAGGMGYQTPVPWTFIFDTDNATVVNGQILRFSNPQVELLMFDQNNNASGSGFKPVASDNFLNPPRFNTDIVLATDNFTRANANPIGAPWITQPTLSAMQLLSNAATASAASNTPCGAVYGGGIQWPNDQYSEITVGTLAVNNAIGTYVRGAAGGATQTAYQLFLLGPSGGTAQIRVDKTVAGVFTTIFQAFTTTVNSGDVWRLEVIGTTLTVKRNGIVITQFQDSSIASGSPGIGANDLAVANGTITNWAGGSPGKWVVTQGSGFNAGNGVVSSAGTSGFDTAAFNDAPFTADQYAQIYIQSAPNVGNSSPLGVCVRASLTAATYYAAYMDNSVNNWFLYKFVAGVETILTSGTYTTKGTDVLTLLVVGTTLYLYINGELVSTTTDGSIATGLPGLVGAGFEGPVRVFGGQWSAGNLGPSPYSSTDSTPLVERQQITWKVGLEASRVVMKISAIGQTLVTGVPFLRALLAGKFDDASVSVDRLYMQSPGDTSLGTVNLFFGNIGEIRNLGRTMAEFDVDSKLQKLSQQMPRNYYQPSCRWTLYDRGCGLSKSAFGVNGSINAGSNLQILLTTLANVDSYFNQGTLIFTSGPNVGLTFSIRLYFNANGQITIYTTLPFPANVGDTFTAYPGCDKSQSTCTNKFGNLVNFSAEPFIPVPELAV